MYSIGFIGSGNVARAMITGMVKNKFDVSNVYVNSNSNESKEKLSIDLLVNCAKNNIDVVKKCKYVFFAVKSHHYSKIIKEIKPHISKDQIFISLAPSFTSREFKDLLNHGAKVVRAMPNTPAYVGEGMTGISFSEDIYSDKEKDDLMKIFSSYGEVEILDEEYMDTIVAISGSAPAYVYIMIEAMADAGVLTGLPRKMSYKLASQAVMGAAKMVRDTGIHPGELKDAVCSPGGTTIEAVKVLEDRGFRSALIESMLACYNKTKNMKK